MKKLRPHTHKLSNRERKDMRQKLLRDTGLEERAPSYLSSMFPRYVALAAYSFLLVIAGCSPVAIAAENAEPGEPLYTIKQNVNEPLKKVVKKIFPEKTPDAAVLETEPVEAAESKAKKDRKDTPTDKKSKNKEAHSPRSGKVKPDIPILTGIATSAVPLVDTILEDVQIDVIPVLNDNAPKKEKQKERDENDDTKQNVTSQVKDTTDSAQQKVEKAADKAKETVSDTVDTVTKTTDKALDTLGL